MKIVVVDTETTGLDPEKDRVVQVGSAVIEYDGAHWKIVAQDNSLVNPGIRIPPEASGIHHIVDADVANAPALEDALSLVIGRDIPSTIAAHNCRFDMGFLPTLKGATWIDTYRCAMHIWPDAPNFANQTLRYWLGIHLPRGASHHAGDDALVTAHILIKLLGERPLDDLSTLSTKAVVLKKVGFGKHFGSQWTEVPLDYLMWAEKQDFDPDIKFTVKSELRRRAAA